MSGELSSSPYQVVDKKTFESGLLFRLRPNQIKPEVQCLVRRRAYVRVNRLGIYAIQCAVTVSSVDSPENPRKIKVDVFGKSGVRVEGAKFEVDDDGHLIENNCGVHMDIHQPEGILKVGYLVSFEDILPGQSPV